MRKTLVIAAVLLASLACCSCNNAGKEDQELVVMSYNIRNSRAKDGDNAWDVRKPATTAMLDKVNPDVFGVQEAYPNQVEFITETCPRYGSYGVGREDGVNDGEHMSIFYNKDKIELLKSGTYWLSETPDQPTMGWDAACKRTATWALMKLKASGKQFYYVNTHLDHVGVEARVKGLALIVDNIADMNAEGLPMVLTGDFNVEPTDSCLFDLNTKMKSARETAAVSDDKPSFTGFGLYPESIIDYIYYSNFSECKDFRVVNETFLNIPYVSDHYPIVSTLKF